MKRNRLTDAALDFLPNVVRNVTDEAGILATTCAQGRPQSNSGEVTRYQGGKRGGAQATKYPTSRRIRVHVHDTEDVHRYMLCTSSTHWIYCAKYALYIHKKRA